MLPPVLRLAATTSRGPAQPRRPGHGRPRAPRRSRRRAAPSKSARSSARRGKTSRASRGRPAPVAGDAASSCTPAGRAAASRKGPVPTGSAPPRAISRGLCIAKKGCDSVASSAALGRSSVIATTWAADALGARPGRRARGAMRSRLASTASASNGAPSWKRTPSRRVNVQRRASGVAQVGGQRGLGARPVRRVADQRLADVRHDGRGDEVGGAVRVEGHRVADDADHERVEGGAEDGGGERRQRAAAVAGMRRAPR